MRNGDKKEKGERNLEGKDTREEGGGLSPFSTFHVPATWIERRAMRRAHDTARVHRVTFAALNSPLLGFMSPAGSGLSDSHTPNSSLQVFTPGSLQRLLSTSTFPF